MPVRTIEELHDITLGIKAILSASLEINSIKLFIK